MLVVISPGTGVVPHMAAALTGLAALLYASAPAFEAMKYVGVAYLLPQFVRPEEPDRIGHLLALSGVFMLETFVVFVAYGLLAAAARNEVIARPRILLWLRRGIAAAFVALGVRLALADRA